jgi:hypothetical protein
VWLRTANDSRRKLNITSSELAPIDPGGGSCLSKTNTIMKAKRFDVLLTVASFRASVGQAGKLVIER